MKTGLSIRLEEVDPSKAGLMDGMFVVLNGKAASQDDVLGVITRENEYGEGDVYSLQRCLGGHGFFFADDLEECFKMVRGSYPDAVLCLLKTNEWL